MRVCSEYNAVQAERNAKPALFYGKGEDGRMIVHKGTRPLFTQRLRLRRFTADDAAAMIENWAGDERVTQKCGFPWEETRRAAVRTAAGEVHDIEVYGMTRSEWKTLQ